MLNYLFFLNVTRELFIIIFKKRYNQKITKTIFYIFTCQSVTTLCLRILKHYEEPEHRSSSKKVVCLLILFMKISQRTGVEKSLFEKMVSMHKGRENSI